MIVPPGSQVQHVGMHDHTGCDFIAKSLMTRQISGSAMYDLCMRNMLVLWHHFEGEKKHTRSALYVQVVNRTKG